MYQNIPSPEQYFGYAPGADRKMTHWYELCGYYRLLARLSDRMKLVECGKTSEGNDFLMIYISEKENLDHLERYREISLKMADPRGLTESEIDALAGEGRAVCMQSYGLHSNEVGGPLAAPHILYELITASEGDLLRVLKNVIFIMSPCSEPDGQILYTEWYRKWYGTEFEGSYSPYLRHNWAGHSNNRDSVNESVIETVYLNDVLIRNWKPQVFQDYHHQCPYDPRMSISPFCDPIHPAIAPLVQREGALYGAQMAYDLSRAGRRGIVSGGDVRFSDYPITTFYGNARLHNTCGMLTESADVAIARPLYIESDARRGIVTSANPDPWEGGMWHLSDIVSQMKIASLSLLTAISKSPKNVLKSMAAKALSQIARGKASKEQFYLLKKEQHDPSARHRFLDLLLRQGVELYELQHDTKIGGVIYPQGTVAIPLAQPYYAVVDLFCNPRPLPLSDFNACDSQGMPLVTDDANVCIALSMGLSIDIAGEDIPDDALGKYHHEKPCCTYGANENESYVKINAHLASGEAVYRDKKGDFHLTPALDRTAVQRHKIGLYKTRYTGNEEEGFTRNLLHRSKFDYRIVLQDELCAGRVPDVDVLIFAGESYSKLNGVPTPPRGVVDGYVTLPDEYYEGLGEVGVATLCQFLDGGGRILAWCESTVYLSEKLDLGIRFPFLHLPANKFSTLGSHIRIHYERSPLTLGIPTDSTVYHRQKTVFELDDSSNIEVFARYAERDVLANGFLIGEEYLAGKPAALRVPYGKGECVFFGFDPQYRMQQDVSFKLIFNALL
ncbi:MAG: hypothetical protein IJX80_01850 [Clostridia bacterium]|nr:hypothetical protein [Clostridia bacterium]